jgi:hypothetical protein
VRCLRRWQSSFVITRAREIQHILLPRPRSIAYTDSIQGVSDSANGRHLAERKRVVLWQTGDFCGKRLFFEAFASHVLPHFPYSSSSFLHPSYTTSYSHQSPGHILTAFRIGRRPPAGAPRPRDSSWANQQCQK